MTSKVIHCWPRHMMDAAVEAGFAKWHMDSIVFFEGDVMRERLEKFIEMITDEEERE